jgi:hypothetical protein
MLARRGQSILEYTIIISIIVVVLFYMGTGIKRGVQSMVKVAADQIGSQQNADQDFSDVSQGYLEGTNTVTQEDRNKSVTEIGYIPKTGPAVYLTNTGYNESTETMSNTLTNGGFTEGQ